MGGFQLLRTFTLSHTMAITEVAVATQLDRAGVDDSDIEQGNDLNFMALKGILTEMPADEQICAAQLVETGGMSSLQMLASSSVIST